MMPVHRYPSLLALCLGAFAGAQQPATQERPVNRLAKETSPYLRQHQHNPVDWYPWGPEALQRAKKEDKPIFLSIGYSACHWCHVMEHESFEDEATAKAMNENFVCIKVDREERPDLDEVYMAAVQAMTGQGGWPLSVWLTPELKPFYGGTYFPPDDRYGRPGFRRVLASLADAWHKQRDKVVAGSVELTQHLQKVLAPEMPPGEPGAAVLAGLRQSSKERFDAEYGGFSGGEQAPKFPHVAELQVLLRLGAGGDAEALHMATLTLDKMLQGGMYDQLGGGFHRYSTDRRWLVPHFEKMLYDNALLVPCYLDAFVLTGNSEYRRTAEETLDYLLREMQDKDGGFYSSQDADSEGEEGRFFVWDRAEVQKLCGADSPVVEARYGISTAGNWEGHNVLFLAEDEPGVAKALSMPLAAVQAALQRCRAKLLAARQLRVHPGTDDKVLTAWNAMAIVAMASGYQHLGEVRYLAAAQRAADFLLRQMVHDGRCLRSHHSGKSQHQGYLEDHAGLADALLSLFECDGDRRWLLASRQLVDAALLHFGAADGSFYFTADDHEQLLARSKSPAESSTPSGIALMVRACLRLGLLLGDEALYAAGTKALAANGRFLEQMPAGCPTLVQVLQWQLDQPREVVVVGEAGDPRTQALLQKAWRAVRHRPVVGPLWPAQQAALAALSPVFADKTLVDGKPAAYVCRHGACDKPVTDPAALHFDDR